jgi:2-polyprenyl-3-methyl-5-hydroxy-6-metoxy-1,4-benzoquinol methylase
MTEKTALFVLGMHRSGTSLMAGCLAALGVDFGSDMVPARKEVNEKGFFEHRQILAVHDQLLALLGSDWADPCALPEQWWHGANGIAEQRRLEAIVHQDLRGPIIGIKDPRLARLMPLWSNLMERENRTAKAIIILRKPSEIAASLKRRDQFSEERGLLLWLTQMLSAEEVTRNMPRLFITFEEILAGPTATCEKIADHLDVPFVAPLEDSREALAAFATPSLHHHQLTSPENPMVAEAWEVFKRAAVDPSFSPAPALEDIRERTNESSALFHGTHNQLAQELEETRNAFRESVEALRQRDHQLDDVSKGFHTALDTLRELGVIGAEAPVPEILSRLPADRPPPLEFSPTLEKTLTITAAKPNESQSLTYQGAIDFSIENNSHSIAFRFLTEASEGRVCRVLEAGCASGYFGNALREFGHDVWGVETDIQAAAVAKESLDNVFLGTIEKFLKTKDRPSEFDFVTFGDVLEHIADPETILRQTRELLAPQGCVIASIPNVAHLAVRSMLLEGRFEYSKLGIMDETHLRFFTRDSILELFAHAGFTVERIAKTVLPVSATGIPVHPASTAAATEFCNDDETDVFQFVILARPTRIDRPIEIPVNFPARTGKRILALPPVADSTLVDIRIRQPLREWSEQLGGHFRCGNLIMPLPEDIAWAEIIVLQREANEPTLALIRQLQGCGKKIVFDIDDLLTEIPDYLLSAKTTTAKRKILEETIATVDAVTVATEPLREAYRELNPNIFVVPNTSPAIAPTPEIATKDNRVALVVASSDTVRLDFITDCLRGVQASRGDQIRLIGIGPPGDYLADQGLDIERNKNLSYQNFRLFLQGLPDAIGLIPLDESRFNSCKSAIKFLDYAQTGVPAICSNVAPYAQVVDDGVTGRLAINETEAWQRIIYDLLDDDAGRAALATAAKRAANQELGSQHAAAAWQRLVDHLEPYPARTTSIDPKLIANLEGTTRALRILDKVRGLVEKIQDPTRATKIRRIWKTEGLIGFARRFAGRS